MQAELDMTAEFAKSDALLAKRAAANALKRDTKAVNDALYGMGRTYHQSVPLDAVNGLLTHYGFNELDAILLNGLLTHYGFNELDAILLCGREGSLHENVGRNRWLSLTWYKMESGRYEVVAYVS